MSGNPEIKASIKEAENHYKVAGAKAWERKYFFILDLHAPHSNESDRNILCGTCKYYHRIFVCCKFFFLSIQCFKHLDIFKLYKINVPLI